MDAAGALPLNPPVLDRRALGNGDHGRAVEKLLRGNGTQMGFDDLHPAAGAGNDHVARLADRRNIAAGIGKDDFQGRGDFRLLRHLDHIAVFEERPVERQQRLIFAEVAKTRLDQVRTTFQTVGEGREPDAVEIPKLRQIIPENAVDEHQARPGADGIRQIDGGVRIAGGSGKVEAVEGAKIGVLPLLHLRRRQAGLAERLDGRLAEIGEPFDPLSGQRLADRFVAVEHRPAC